MLRTWECNECRNSCIEFEPCRIQRDTKKPMQKRVSTCPFYVDTYPVWKEITDHENTESQ